jgi:hypothetical protein
MLQNIILRGAAFTLKLRGTPGIVNCNNACFRDENLALNRPENLTDEGFPEIALLTEAKLDLC